MSYKVAIVVDMWESKEYDSLANSVADRLQMALTENNYESIIIEISKVIPDIATGIVKTTVADYTSVLDKQNPNLIISIKSERSTYIDPTVPDISLVGKNTIYLQHNSSSEQKAANYIKQAFPLNVKTVIFKGQVLQYYRDIPMLKFVCAENSSVGSSAGDYIAQGILNYLRGEGIKNQEQETQDEINSAINEIHSSEPSYELMDYTVEATDYDIPTAAAPAVQASIAASSDTVVQRIHEKQLTLHSDYLIYFDDVLMNDYILSYNVNIGVDIGIGNASISMMYSPSFNKIKINDSISDGVDNGIQLRIFISNVFSGKYNMVFDGIIKQKILSRDSSGFQLTFTAVDYVYWMNKIIAPISIPFNQAISPGERLKWKAQSIDPEKTANVVTAKAGSLKGKSIQEYFDTLKEKAFTNSNVCSDSNGVINWDDTINRVEIMGDINKELTKYQVIDFVINSNSVFADTVYVSMANTTNNLMMEFYQDRDGIIRIKPPFWNEPVLKNHVIDPMMVISSSESTDWTKYYTRIIVTGGVEEWMPESGSSSSKVDLLTPVGVYLGSLTDKDQAKWADYTSEGERGSSYRQITVNGGSGGTATTSNSSKDYIEGSGKNIGTISDSPANDLQKQVADIAKNSGKYGIAATSKQCLKWVDDVVDKATGKQGKRVHCAAHAGSVFGCSNNWKEIKIGAAVFGYSRSESGWNLGYGHAGIYVGNNQVYHNIGGVTHDSLSDWVEKYRGICWGWAGGIVLDSNYPCKNDLMKCRACEKGN